MNIKEAKEEIKRTVLAYTRRKTDGSLSIPADKQRPLLLIGPPGIGKTAIMEQVAGECGIGLVSYTITHHTRQSAIGLPVIRQKNYGGREYSVTEYTMSEIIASVYECMERTGEKEGILFIDEINCVSETLAPAMLEFLQCKRFGNHTVPEGFMIVAAGNPDGYNKSVRDFDVVTLDRVRYFEVKEDLDVFLDYGAGAGLHEAILSFLAVKPQSFYRMEPSEKRMQFVTARGWEDLSRMLYVYEELSLPVTEDFVFEFLQYLLVASEFTDYYKLYKTLEKESPVETILKGQADASLISKVNEASYEEKVCLIHMLAQAILRTGFREADFLQVFTFLKKVSSESYYERILLKRLLRDKTFSERILAEPDLMISKAVNRFYDDQYISEREALCEALYAQLKGE